MDSFFVKTDHEKGLVILVATGEITKSDGEKIITVARTTAAEYKYLAALYDLRQSRTSIPIVELFQLSRNLEVYKIQEMRTIKAAILISPDDEVDKYKFYETVTDNLGIRLKIFFDESQALEWLAAKPPPTVPGEIISDK